MRGYVELVVAGLAGTVPMKTESLSLLGLEAGELEVMARTAGAVKIRLFGGYQHQAYDRQESADLLMIAEKPG